jgi:polyribonucleotide nucleotidyltransferase
MEHVVNVEFGGRNVTISTGKLAKQANGAVMVRSGDTMVLVTAVATKEAKEGQDFFPLTVNYTEKAYAGGKIPGGFFKREARPSDAETLICRLIDRPIRPLFPENFLNDTQVMATVVSADKDNDPGILSMLGASAALMVSDIPFQGPIAGAKVGRVDGRLICNPTAEELEKSDMEIVVAASRDAIIMVEGEAKFVSEADMLEAIFFAKESMLPVIEAQEELQKKAGVAKREIAPPVVDEALLARVRELAYGRIGEAVKIKSKQERHNQIDLVTVETIGALKEEFEGSAKQIKAFLGDFEYERVRTDVLETGIRIDGRDTVTIRPIATEAGLLPRVHGSALFTRGETQALVVATLGTARDAQLLDTLEGERKDAFMLHYNFPPFSVGECGRMGSPGRREIGHGRLARRGVAAMLPTQADFPYTIRVVSEITESNGSSSMASVCGASLALMDAGVPVKAPVAGIAMGLVKEGDKFAVLTDILGDEDHLGDMDFKVAGTDKGVTALQMDIKINGITEEIMEIALNQALEARLNILGQMNAVIAKPRAELSENAPTMIQMKIDSDKIRDVIGKGGATIRGICEETKASIDIEDDGSVKIYGETREAAEAAKQRVLSITAEAEIGKIYVGKVERIVDFGAFVNILPGKDGLVHISQISDKRIEKVTDVLKEGQEVKVLVLDVDNRGRIKLSIKDVEAAEASGV